MVLHGLMNTKISGENVLVTGAGGFIAGLLVKLLAKKDIVLTHNRNTL
jgi:nucleoside-diphosphate-sugar epimerase